MKFVVVLLALTAVVLGQDAAICNSVVQSNDGSSYSLAGLTLYNGDFYSYVDTQTGITYYWNTCSEITDLCGDNAAACFSVGGVGDMNVQSYYKAGSYDDFFYQVNTDGGDEQISVTFYGGEYCADLNTNRLINFVYHCNPYASQPNVTSVDNNQDCAVTVNIDTNVACSNMVMDGDMPYYHHFHLTHYIMIFVWIFVALSACICCCACCAILRRRRCQRNGSTGGWCKRYCNNKKGAYTELSTVETPVPVSQPAPTAPVAQQPGLAPPQFYPVQYIPAQQYYMMQQQYMQQQQQFMQAQVPQQQPAPVVELENVSHDSQVEADEKLARELQAQLNAQN